MTGQEVELWVRDILKCVLANQRIEHSRVELKSSWLEPRRAADRLAAHANASRGTPILWIIGVDEKEPRLAHVNPVERADWLKSVESFFDGFAPRLAVDVNVRSEDSTVVALYFETHQGAPFVVQSTKGSYPEFVVPWREGTRLRAARRDELLRILVPIRRFASLIDELDFNFEVAREGKTVDHLGALFRENEFHRLLSDGALSSLPSDLRTSVTKAYVAISRANHEVTAFFSGAVTASPAPSGKGCVWCSQRSPLMATMSAHLPDRASQRFCPAKQLRAVERAPTIASHI